VAEAVSMSPEAMEEQMKKELELERKKEEEALKKEEEKVKRQVADEARRAKLEEKEKEESKKAHAALTEATLKMAARAMEAEPIVTQPQSENLTLTCI